MRLLILFQLLSLIVWGQLPKTKDFYSSEGFCSRTILLDSLGNFYKEEGCEGRSRISFGTYKITGDIIYFTFQKFDSLQPIFNITESPFSNDFDITVTFLTRQGNTLRSSYFSVDAIDTSGKFFQTIRLNDSGQIKVNMKKYKELRLDYLENVHHKKVRIPITNKDITVILNQSQLFFNYQRPRLENGNNFSMQLKKDGLYSGKQKAYSLEE